MSPETQPEKREPTRLKRYGLIALAIVASYAIAYFLGYFQASRDISTLREQYRLGSSAAQKAKDDALRELLMSQKQAQTLEARLLLDQAIFALDARNFGIAQQALKDAATRLNTANVTGKLLEQAKAMEGFRLFATEDLGAQRQKLVELGTAFDQRLKSP